MKDKAKQDQEATKHRREFRYFSEDFRKARVKEFDEGPATVLEISRVYGLSKVAVYRWIDLYSVNHQKGIRKVVELESETVKRRELEKHLAEVERLLGQKTVEVEFWRKLVEMAEEKFGIDLKKNVGSTYSNGSGNTPEKDGPKG